MITNSAIVNSVSNREQQIIFIDSQVKDYQFLAQGVLPGIQTVILNRNSDGIEQITEVLTQKNNYTSIHIVSHGSPGCLYLGNSQLSLDTLNQYQSELKTWFNIPPLSRGVRGDLDLLNQGVRGHILLYGCNVAAGDAGEEFITKLQAFTGAEIAASTTRIGNSDKGGNWQLDVTTSVDRPNLAFTKEAQQNYAGVLIDLFTDDFESGNANVWAFGTPNDATGGRWTINTPTTYSANGATVQITATNPVSSSNSLFTGAGSSAADDIDGGTTTVISSNFTLPSNASSIDLSFYYFFGFGLVNGGGGTFTARLVDASNNDNNTNTLETLVDLSTTTNRDAEWTLDTTSLLNHAGEEVYLEFSAADVGGGDVVEAGIDDVSVTYEPIVPNEISGNVFLDANFNGANNSDSGVQNITVNAYDATGTSVATANTDSNGDYTLTGLTDGTEYRIEFTNLPSGYFSAPTGTDNNGSVVFVSSPESSVDFGVVDPSSVDFSAPIPNSNIVQNGYAVYSCLGVETTDVVLAIRNLNSIGDVYDVPSNRGDVDSSSNFAQATTFTRSQFEDNQIQATTIGDDGSIYVSTSGLYNNQRPTSQGGNRPDPLVPIADPKVYRISPDGSTVELFATLPGNQGTGWMEIDEEHNQIYVSNPDDGLIYVVDSTATAGSQTASTSYTTFAPHSADALNDADTNTSGAVGFAPLGENILGVGYNKAESRLYYAIWAQDLTPNASADNTIRSIGVNPDGSFDLASDRLELTIPNENFWGNGTEVNDSSMPTLDIEFNEDGTVMLLAELTIDYDFTAVRPAHASRVLEYRGSTNNWTSETFEKHSIGQIRNFTATNGADFDNNSRGGVDFAFHTIENGNPEGYEDYVIATGDALPFDQGTDPDTLIYGFQYQPLTGGDQDSSLKIDGDGLSANQKGTFADIDVRVAYEGSIEIGNRIWNDTDADGIQDPGEAGISNVTINLYNAAGDTLLGTTTTNADGEYYFNESNVNQNGATGLEPNTSYQIQIDSSTGGLNSLNLVPQDQGANDAIDSDADDSSGTPTISITTGDYGENNYSLDAGFALTYSLSGTVYSDTNNPSGDSIEASDTPIGGVTVTLYDAADTEFASPIATTTTDATTGFYEFTNLLDGNYVVIQDQPGAYDSVTDIDGTDDNQISVTVAGADVTGQDFLEEKVVSLGSTVFTDTDNDGVQDTGEGGISGVDVELYSPGADGVVGGGDDTLVDSTTTDGDGNYQFSDLPERDYYVSIPTSNFASGEALENTPLSSETTETTDNQVDGDDNGIQANIGEATNSPVINLTANGEPVDGTGANDETGTGADLDNGSGVANDSDGDMTVDFGFAPVYSLSGTVYEDTNNPSGDTIETTDAPIPGVTINLYADSDGNGVADTDGSGNLLAPIATTTTNSSGFYEFTDLSNGNYVVIQDQPGDYNSLTDVNGTTPDNQIAVIIADANVIERDFLEEGNYDYGDAPDTQEGGVAAPNSSTIADYQTTEDDSGAAHKLKEDSLITIGDTVDADNGIQQNTAANADIPDENGVTVSGTTDSLNGTNVTATSGNNLSVDVEVNLDVREPTGVAVTFSGTVFDDYDNDGTQEIANTPSEVGLEDIIVTAYNNAGNVVATTNTDASGAYTINNTNGEALRIEFSNLPGGYVASAGSGSRVIFSDGTADETVDVGFYDPSGSTSLEIGNRVWVDLDKDGIQDAGEAGVAGATVSLYDSTGTTLLGTTVTNAKGEYYFNSDNVKQNGATGLEPNTDYKIRLDNAADFASGGALENLNITTVDAGSNDELDSDAVLEDVSGTDTPTINVTTVNDGQNDYSNDFGFQKDVTLVGWIDFDRSGTFDPDEAVTIDTANGLNTDGTANTLDFNLPADVELGATAARFRVASGLEGDNLDGTTPNGAVPDGEVEDYVVNLVGTDYGDAPDTSDGTGEGDYQTTDKTGTDNDGASHTIVSDLTIGNVVDADNGELQNSAANADNVSNTGSANDEDGLIEFNGGLPLNINADDSFTATVSVTNNSGEAATLVGWVDFNQNGVFENTEEVIANIPTATNNENVTLTWDRDTTNNAIFNLNGNGDLPAIANIEAGTTYARFRLSTDSQLDEDFSTGNAQDGEVEDYQLNLGVDYSDAPDADGETATGNYDTTADSDPGTTDTGGAPHGIVDGLSIGDTVDDDSGLLHDVDASLDDTTDTGSSDDEDGVTFNTTSFSIANDDSYSVDVDVNIPTTTLQAEESFTQNYKGGNGWTSGEWTEVGESDGVNAGRVQVNGGLLEFSNGDRSIEREFDFSTATGDGTLTFDYSYENLAAGETVTVTVSNDNNTETPVTFTIDNTGTASNTPNQDASLTIPQALLAGGASKITITSVGGNEESDRVYIDNIDLTAPVTEPASLVGWVDFNQNGAFETEEGVITTVTSSGTETLVWDRDGATDGDGFGVLPDAANIESGTTYSRFRLTQNPITTNDSIGFRSTGEVEDYKVNLGIDYGDAPDAGAGTGTGDYETTDKTGTDNDGAAHGIDSNLTIGDNIDDDSGSLQNAAADADNADGTPNDEDGVTLSTTPFSITSDSSYSTTVNVSNNTGEAAKLVGWIDFNQNGVFEATEAVSADVPDGTTTTTDITLTWDRDGATDGSGFGVLPDAADIESGSTYARFRLTTDDAFDTIEDTDSVGFLNNGEVEDHRINLGVDYGDAPDAGAGTGTGDYETTDKTGTDDDGAAHGIVDDIFMGSTVDDDLGSNQNSAADADDSDGTPDDEDGVTFNTTPLNIADDSNYSATVNVTNNTGEPAKLIGWIDFNQDGQFDATEAVRADVPDGTTGSDVTLTWDRDGGTSGSGFGVLPDAANIETGTTYARFRLSTDCVDGEIKDSHSVGFLKDGEVEDYKLNLGIDYGDAPDAGAGTAAGDYETTDKTGTDDDGAAHGIDSNLTIGDNIDDDSGSLQNAAANADNNDDIPNDEDGVTLSSTPFSITNDSSYSTIVNVNNNTGEDAKLVGWIDFNQNGIFEATEAVSADVPDGTTTATDITLTWDRDGATDGSGFGVLPDAADIESGTTYARLRLTTDNAFDTIEDTDSVGFLNNGEVEDYKLNLGVDYGDAPDAGAGTGVGDYETTDKTGTDDDGAAHGIVSDLLIGSNIDDDSGSLQNPAADADDTNGTPDDEDGVTFSSTSLNIDTDNSYSSTVNVTNNTGQTAKLIGWIDFDRDGIFEATEAVSANVPNGTAGSDVTLTWDRDGGTSGNGFGVLPNAASIESGTSYARFRLTTDPITTSNSTGFASDGEVEDYQLDLVTSTEYKMSGKVYSDTNNPSEDSIEDTDTPIGEVTLKLYTDSDGDGVKDTDDSGNLLDPIATTTTDADTGEYEFTGLANGSYVVAQDQPADYDSVTDVDNTTPDNQIAVTINDGDEIEKDFLEEKVVFIGSTVFTDSNNNGVQDTGEAGISGVDVELYAPGADGVVGGVDDTLIDSTTTDGDGNYQFSDLPEGDYYVSIPTTNFASGGALETAPLSSETTETTDNQVDGDDNGIQANSGEATNSPVINLTANGEPVDGTGANDETGTGSTLDNGSGVADDSDGDMTVDFGFVAQLDYGDAPDDGNTGNSAGDYNTLDSNNGPSHGIVNGLTLGSTVDAESDASPNTTATGDDTTGSDDEDGIEFIDTKIISNDDANDSYSVQAIVNATGDATLVGWIDFDRDGTFDSTEGVTLSSDLTKSTDGSTTLNTDGTTANILTWTGINSQTNGVTPGDTYARFRLSSDDLTTNDATGAASDGEVEDYALKIKNEVSGTGAGEVINDTYTSDPNTANDDLIIGGAGQDTLSGGDGDDCFHFNRTSDGIDIITDFKENGDADKLDFSDMFATGGELEGIENPFGTYVIATSDASGTLVQVDFVPGDDLNNKNVVYLQGYTDTLTADDFVF